MKVIVAPRIYIASKFASRKRLIPIRQQLQIHGFVVLSTWMIDDPDSSADIDSLGNDLEESARLAMRDYQEIISCHLFVIDTTDDSSTGGREVELGYAQALHKPSFRVGPIRNVFHALITGFPSWTILIEHLINVYSIKELPKT